MTQLLLRGAKITMTKVKDWDEFQTALEALSKGSLFILLEKTARPELKSLQKRRTQTAKGDLAMKLRQSIKKQALETRG